MRFKNLENLHKVLQNEFNQGFINGSAIRVLQDNDIIYEDELGFADKEKGVPIKKDTIYRLYSMSKPIMTVAAMILYEKGLLDLFAPVSDYLDGFHNQKVLTDGGLIDVKRPVLIKDLLNMTSGIVYPDMSFEAGKRMDALYSTIAEECKQGNSVNTIDFCNRIGEQPLEFQPGERWRYGASADILGAVVEVISGMKLSEFLEEKIFSPLGMVDTGFYVPEEKLSRFAVVYEYIEERKQLEPCYWTHIGLGDFISPPAFESGGAGLVSTVEDYSRFAMMLANGGIYDGIRILGSKTVEYISKPQLNAEQSVFLNWESLNGYNYGNLMRTLIDPVVAASNGSVGEFGWDGWTGNYFFVDPKEKLIVIYMTQKCNGGNPKLIRLLRSIIYSSIR
jgi:CubicO group peptidase (beta-lactamase class C family)